LSDPRIARCAVVHGHVQGVFFRDSCRRRAQSLGVTGWIRNREDATVELLAEGAREAVEQLIEWCREGPRGAYVEHVDVYDCELEGRHEFTILG
jgi:acylphosphatase